MAIALLFLGGLGAAAALLLGIASRVFYVKEDPLIGEVENALPGANCGGCGYAGCRACAEAIVAGKEDANVCVAGGFETAVEVGAVMGIKVEAREPELAQTSCTFGTDTADLIYRYNGAQDCQAAVALFGGSKLCPIGCIGLGSCVKACQFSALTIGPDHLPQFNPNNCVGCGACVKACPKGIIALTASTHRIIDEYNSDECTAPCQRACPTGIDIPRYIREIRHGRFEQALLVIKERCPLPLVCGRICPAPCEFECRRNLAGDEPVGINPLKRFAADYEMQTGKHVNPYVNAASGKRTAVIGAGAEGLTSSYYLARLGHAPTLFEAQPKLGGILRYVISPGRLPEGTLDHEIQGILEMGVEAQTGKVLGRDFTIASLIRDGYDAVLLTTGGFDSRKILKPGSGREQLVPGVHLMVDFFDQKPAVGKRVMIVGGASSARAVADLCRQQGAESILFVTSAEDSLLPDDLKDLTVFSSTVLTSLLGKDEALVGAGLAPVGDDEDAVRYVDVDTVIAAAGRIPELSFVKVRTADDIAEDEDLEPEVFEGLSTHPVWRTAPLYRTFPAAQRDGLFSSPEAGRTSDASAVVRAILSGRRIVRGVHQHLTGLPITPVKHLALEADEILNVTEIAGVSPRPRQHPAAAPPEPSTSADWTAEGEITGLIETEARKEAERCLQCGLICYEKAE